MRRSFIAGAVAVAVLFSTVRWAQSQDPKVDASRADQRNKLLDALYALEQEMPKDLFEARSVAEKNENEPTRIFRWVRDETMLVPYLGVLRGERGMLMDRSGNSLDRALLLGGLLTAAKFEVRLAHAALSEEQAGKLLEGVRARKKRPATWSAVDRSPEQMDESIRPYVKKFQLDEKALHAAIERALARRKTLMEAAALHIREHKEWVSSALGSLDSTAAEQFQRKALADHYWIQWKHGDAWVDLDPSFADAKPGRTIAPAQETPPLAPLGDELYQTVQIDVVAEMAGSGGRLEKVLLSHTLRAAESSGERILFRALPLRLPVDFDALSPGEDAAKVVETYVNHSEWLPTLQVGDKLFYQASITTDGSVNEKPPIEDLKADAASQGSGTGLEAVGKTMGTKLLPSGAPGQPEGNFTALWLEYRIHSPGAPETTIRRAIFDLIGPDSRQKAVFPAALTEEARARRASALTGETEMLILGGRLAPEYVEGRAAKVLSGNRDAFTRAMQGDATLFSGTEAGKLLPLFELPSELHALAFARQETGPAANETYVGSPNVFSIHRSVDLGKKSDDPLVAVLDIVHNQTLSLQGIATAVEQGIADTWLESLVGDSAVSAAELLEKARKAGTPLTVVRSPQDAAQHLGPLDPDSRQRIEEMVKAGSVVLVPVAPQLVSSPRETAWWTVDPATGQTLGVALGGQGAALTQDAKALRAAVLAGTWLACRAVGGTPRNCGLPAPGWALELTSARDVLAVVLMGLSE